MPTRVPVSQSLIFHRECVSSVSILTAQVHEAASMGGWSHMGPSLTTLENDRTKWKGASDKALSLMQLTLGIMGHMSIFSCPLHREWKLVWPVLHSTA